MNRLTKLCALCAVLLTSTSGSNSVSAEERTAPSLPASVFQTYEDDKDYYLSCSNAHRRLGQCAF